MMFKDFFKNRVSDDVFDRIETEYEMIFIEMCNTLDNGDWLEAQKKTQKKNILPLIAIYKSLLNLGLDKEEAKAISRQWFEMLAKKFHNMMNVFTHVPFFKSIFSSIFKKKLKEPGIWGNQVIKDNKDEFVVDITKCLWKDTCDYFNVPELCEVFCDGDWIVFGDLNKLHLEREGTVGTGSEKCDFRFVFDKKDIHKD